MALGRRRRRRLARRDLARDRVRARPDARFSGHIANPLGWTGAGPALRVIGFVGFVALAVTAVATVASVGWRFYRGDAAVRAQLRWLLAVVAVIAVTIAVPGPKALGIVILALNVIATFLLPVTLAVTLIRRDGLVLPRLLLYGSLSGPAARRLYRRRRRSR